MEPLKIEKKIHALDRCGAITFAHKSDIGRKNEHTLHLNDHVEIYIFIKGDVHYLVEDRYFVLQEGDVLVISPYSPHVPIIKNECDYERFYLLFPTDALSEYPAAPMQALLHAAARQTLIRLPDSEKQTAISLLYRMSELSQRSFSAHAELLLHALAVEFVCLLNMNVSGEESFADEATRGVPPLVRHVLEYIQAHAAEITGIAPIAEAFYVSKQHLATIFKKHVGVTVNEYLLTKKISNAKQLLEQGRSVTFTCFECGFNDCSYFIKVFKRMVGMTPNKYLRQNGKG